MKNTRYFVQLHGGQEICYHIDSVIHTVKIFELIIYERQVLFADQLFFVYFMKLIFSADYCQIIEFSINCSYFYLLFSPIFNSFNYFFFM